jgi:murein DD-endopeptidase MepM/ murein hydrolase activator NlpD
MRFHPILHYTRLHAGIDFGAPVGSPVRAVDDGKIEIAGEVSGFGNHVRIQHRGFETSYSHLSEILATTHPGAEVKRGDLIAYSGNTGLSTGPHLHFEFYLDRTAVDPLPHMAGEALAGGPMEGAAHVSAAAPSVASGPHLLTPQEIAEFPAFRAQIDEVLKAEAK